MRRTISAGITLCAAALVIGVIGTPIASAQQSFNVYLGGFAPKSEDSRTDNDVLVNDLTVDPALAFNVSDFHAFTFGGEYLVGLGPLFEAGLGIGYQSSSVPSVYANLTNSDGSEIEQTLRLRDVPMSATIRFLPLGHNRTGVQPYVGGGVGIHAWHYSETGQFVDVTNAVFRQTFEACGTATGPLIIGGVR